MSKLDTGGMMFGQSKQTLEQVCSRAKVALPAYNEICLYRPPGLAA